MDFTEPELDSIKSWSQTIDSESIRRTKNNRAPPSFSRSSQPAGCSSCAEMTRSHLTGNSHRSQQVFPRLVWGGTPEADRRAEPPSTTPRVQALLPDLGGQSSRLGAQRNGCNLLRLGEQRNIVHGNRTGDEAHHRPFRFLRHLLFQCNRQIVLQRISL